MDMTERLYNAETVEALEEAKRISTDSNTKRYTDVHQMFNELLGEEENEKEADRD